MGRTSERRFEAARRFVADAYAGADAIKDAKGDLGFFGSRAFFYLPPTGSVPYSGSILVLHGKLGDAAIKL